MTRRPADAFSRRALPGGIGTAAFVGSTGRLAARAANIKL